MLDASPEQTVRRLEDLYQMDSGQNVPPYRSLWNRKRPHLDLCGQGDQSVREGEASQVLFDHDILMAAPKVISKWVLELKHSI